MTGEIEQPWNDDRRPKMNGVFPRMRHKRQRRPYHADAGGTGEAARQYQSPAALPAGHGAQQRNTPGSMAMTVTSAARAFVDFVRDPASTIHKIKDARFRRDLASVRGREVADEAAVHAPPDWTRDAEPLLSSAAPYLLQQWSRTYRKSARPDLRSGGTVLADDDKSGR